MNWLVATFVFLISIQICLCDENLEEAEPPPKMAAADECSYCQRVLFMTFVGYQRGGDSVRLLRHKLKHICKRYYEYKRRCLLVLIPQLESIGDGMRAALITHRYKPISTCKLLKECDKDQSPLASEEMAKLRESVLAANSSFVFVK
ncbi:Saposin B-type domain-containing protein [Aphelenchoides besseyi]|nr:Saposin B-type domain-containing protein [Aphelenchoides besseyi]KAI6211721.1 Saposin B-type domain-containing protein [Aphelenchoides besseyi]